MTALEAKAVVGVRAVVEAQHTVTAGSGLRAQHTPVLQCCAVRALATKMGREMGSEYDQGTIRQAPWHDKHRQVQDAASFPVSVSRAVRSGL